MNILLVDDETAFAQSLAEGLEMVGRGFHVITAENGEQAMKTLQTAPFDLIITDLTMPIMDGFELLKYIRRERPETRVIVMSMLNGPDVCGRLSELGVTRFIEKPVDLSEVLTGIQAAYYG